MKLTIILIALLSIATTRAEKEREANDAKDKREAAVGYPSSSHSYQAPSLGNEGASAISIGAGYSVGGAKPSYSSYEGQGYSGSHSQSSEGLPASGHATIQLPPITLQPSHGNLVGSDLSQLMSQLQHSLDSGALTLQAPSGYGGFQSVGQSPYGGQEQSLAQFSYASPKLQQYRIAEQSQPSVPSYASGTKGLGSYSSTGPVLFNPSDAQLNTQNSNHASPTAGYSFGSGGLSFGNAGHSFAGASSSTGGSHGGSGNSLSSPYKSFGNSYATSGKNTFKPSAYIGSSVQSDSSQGLSVISPSYGAPSFASAPSQSGGHTGHSQGADSHSGASLGSGSYDGHSQGNLGGFSLTSANLDGHSQSSAGGFGGQSLGSGSFGGHSLGSGGFGGHSLNPGSLGGHSLSSGVLGGHSLSSGALGGHSLNSGSLGGHSLSSGSLGGQSLGSGSHGGLSFGSGDLSSLSLTSGGHGSHGGLSFGSGGPAASFGGSYGGFGGGSTKYISNSYLPAKSEGFGSISSYTAGLTAPPKTTYGHPSGSYLPANAAYSASSHTPQYYVSKSQPSYSSNFGAGSSSYKAPVSSQSSLKSYPKYSTGATGGYSGLSAMYGAAKDFLEGAFSENSYNTIKYSQELKASP